MLKQNNILMKKALQAYIDAQSVTIQSQGMMAASQDEKANELA